MHSPTAVLFDLDGTLIDSLRDLADSGNEVLSCRGLPIHPVDAYRTFVGDGMSNLVKRIFPEGLRPDDGPETEVVLAEYREVYGRNWKATTTLFPGVAGLLDELEKRGIPKGVLSNKSHDFTLQCVEEFLGNWNWDVVFGARQGVPTKPAPQGAIEAAQRMNVLPHHCFFLGDSDVDVATAKNAAMRAIGVSWGFRTVQELNSSGAEAIINHPLELLSLLG